MLSYLTVAAVAAQAAFASPVERAACSPLELVIARGTSEPGVYGSYVGDPLFAATKALIPTLTAYAVNYPASLDCGSRLIGINDAVAHVKAQSAACPKQKFALVGYSQGGDVIDAAATRLLTAKLDSKIVAIVEFGDPNNRGKGQIDPLGGVTVGPLPAALANKQRQNCIAQDPICTNNGTQPLAHVSYSTPGFPYIPGSAAYIAKQFASGGTSGADKSAAAAPGTQTDANVAALLQIGQSLGSSAAPNCTSVS